MAVRVPCAMPSPSSHAYSLARRCTQQRAMSLQRILRTRPYSTSSRPRSPHADFYASLLPAMIPVALLGSAVYLGLHLVQSRLAHEKFLDEVAERIRLLEEEVDSLQRQRSSAAPTIPTSEQVSPSKSRSWWS